MHRSPLQKLLARYAEHHPEERAVIARIQSLVAAHADCFERTCLPGHVTASSWILSEDGQEFLLTHHRKLDRWLQLGGHTDGVGDVRAAALREAREESGMERFRIVVQGDEPLPIDVDVHRIPARGNEPAHEHHDIRFLFQAVAGQPIVRSDESNDLRWFRREELAAASDDPSVLRLAEKADVWLAGDWKAHDV